MNNITIDDIRDWATTQSDYTRGRVYYADRRVKTYNDRESNGLCSVDAVVRGTHSYQVHVTMHEGQILRASCTCQAFDGTSCKHIICVLFTYREKHCGGQTAAPRTDERLDRLIRAYRELPDDEPQEAAAEPEAPAEAETLHLVPRLNMGYSGGMS